MKWRYYLQEAVYTIAIKKLVKEREDLKGYKVLPFQFLYISRFEKVPLLYTVSEKWHKAALNGFTTTSGYKYRGLNELIDSIKWHWKNKIFDTPKEIHTNSGQLTIEDDFIVI